MPRWKETKQLLALEHDGEVFDEDWMNYNSISQYAPPSPSWDGARPMRVDDVDIWEVITEMSGPIGVYAAWCPYDELYIVTNGWRIVAEFSGWRANERLEQYLKQHSIPYPYTPQAPQSAPVEPTLLVHTRAG